MSDPSITPDSRYTATSGRVFLSGTQALVRLPMLQAQRDRAAGMNTAGFIAGYRGSPLGGLDQALWQAKPHLDAHRIVFQPAVNEDLAATAVWGTQQLGLFPGARYDGVFAMWYGKGPGVDRCGDVFRHANAAGTASKGGVLVIAGDDHAAKSSTLPHQTEHVFKAVMMPVLYPANVQEYLDHGLHGWAMSRYSGCWVVMKALADTVETSASVLIDPAATVIRLPDDYEMPAGDPHGLNIRWPDPPLQQEARLLNHKLYAALAYCRANQLDRVLIDSDDPANPARLGIITAGKAYLDVRQALDELAIDDGLAARIGIRLYKVGMVWPLEPDGVRRFAEGLEEILVVEEKRQLLEYQLKEELYNWREDVRPRVVGKFDEKGEWSLLPTGSGHLRHGDWLLPAAGELSVAQVARALALRIGRFFTSPAIEARLRLLEAKQQSLTATTTLAASGSTLQRTPHFCSGCPHNTSTRLPAGSRAVAGIGCHYMVTWMDRNTSTFTHMGGEGVTWVGQAPFSGDRHIFANLGDGTYFHSGLLAIRQAVAAGVSITYKILYNDAVAMTGGQPVDGQLSVGQLTRQLEAEGISRIVIVSDEPEKYGRVRDLAPNTPVRHRDQLDAVQRGLREHRGVSILTRSQAGDRPVRVQQGSFVREWLLPLLAGKTRAVINVAGTPTAEFTRNPDWQFPQQHLQELIDEACGKGTPLFLDSAEVSRNLLGDGIHGNLFLLGVAWQKGLAPLSLAAIDRAIELNHTAVEQNRQAFLWGRRMAHDPQTVQRLAVPPGRTAPQRISASLGDLIDRRIEALTDYQDARYAERYRQLVERVRASERPLRSTRLSETVARGYFKLLAVKDEYEVARRHSDPPFRQQLSGQFEGDFRVRFHFAPPLLAKPDPATGRVARRSYGPWMMRALGILSRLKVLRGFGHVKAAAVLRMWPRRDEPRARLLPAPATTAAAR
jgi:TPP-dependent indolepyruvate ferredoxin oxidoreductase alpha subunit